MFIEYPKSLYLKGDIEADHVIVNDSEEEAQKRGVGYRVAWEPEEKASEPAKRGRPQKAQ